MKKKIILASTSPQRHNLAQQMGLEFEIVPSNYKEDISLKLPPEKLVMTLAYGKAEDVSKKFNKGIVIGIDTLVIFKNKRLGKPKNKKEAFKMLKSLSGKKPEVYSGVVLIDSETGKTIRDFEVTKLHFRKLDDSEIKKYIATGEPLNKAGAFGIHALGSIFIKKVEGCYFNVVGFPIHNIYKNLKKLGADIFEYEKWKQKK